MSQECTLKWCGRSALQQFSYFYYLQLGPSNRSMDRRDSEEQALSKAAIGLRCPIIALRDDHHKGLWQSLGCHVLIPQMCSISVST